MAAAPAAAIVAFGTQVGADTLSCKPGIADPASRPRRDQREGLSPVPARRRTVVR
jgi:hypothetical protein